MRNREILRRGLEVLAGSKKWQLSCPGRIFRSEGSVFREMPRRRLSEIILKIPLSQEEVEFQTELREAACAPA
jgi:hypothetical protein